VHLIEDIHAVLSGLRHYPNAFNEVPDIVDGIVGGSIKLVDIERS
jgi:hypothetical protein